MTTFNDPDFQAQDYGETMPEFADAGIVRIPAGVVELRVHGVAGGTPEQNLGDPHPIKISGDNQAGVYRRRSKLNSGPQRTVEAYNWSSMNSGRTARAFWLVLFPFAAVNFAGWLLPADMREPRPIGSTDSERKTPWEKVKSSPVNPWNNRMVAQMCVRGMALAITAIVMLGIATISVDIVGLQCGAENACSQPWWFAWFEPIRTSSILDGQPTRFAIVGTLVPVAALGGLWLLSRQSSTYDQYGVRSRNEASGPSERSKGPVGRHVDTIRLDTVDFWQSPDAAYIQGWLHTSVALGTLAVMLAASMRVLAPNSPHHGTFLFLAIAAAGLLVVLVVFVGMVSFMSQIPRSWLRRSDSPRWRPRQTWIPSLVAGFLLSWVALLGWGAKGTLDTGSPVLEPIRNGLIVATLLGGSLIFALAMLVGAWRVMTTIIAVGLMWYFVLAPQNGVVGEPPFVVDVGGAWAWIVAEVLAAAVFLAIVWWRSNAQNPLWWRSTPSRVDEAHRHGLLWIVGSAGVLAGIGMGADARNDGNPLIVFAVATSVVLVFLLVSFSMRLSIGRAQRRLDAPERGTMRSGTTFVMAAVAMCSILAMVASTTVWISKALGDAVAHSGVTQVGAGQIEYPAEAGWFALAAFVGFVVLFGIIAIRIGTLRWFRWRNDVAKGICEEYDVVPPPALSDEPPRCEPLRDPATQDVGDHYGWRLKYAKRIRTRRLWANLIDEIDWMITSAVMATLAALGASVVARMRDEQPGGHVDDAVAIATWVLTFLAIAVFFLVRSARDDRQLRGTVGILWEVMGFFPRRFHPLAPPCYSERTVIELRNRVIEYTKADDDGGKIILAHSQGTMLTTAALLSLNGPPPTIPAPKQAVPKGSELDHLAFVTYGCMLERLFGRAWPDQLQKQYLVNLKARIEHGPNGPKEWAMSDTPLAYPTPNGPTRWMNFGRYTDYLGGRVFAPLQPKPTPNSRFGEWDVDVRPRDDIMFQDPTRRWRFLGETTAARAWLHSFNYESDAEDSRFRSHVWEWARRFAQESADSADESPHSD